MGESSRVEKRRGEGLGVGKIDERLQVENKYELQILHEDEVVLKNNLIKSANNTVSSIKETKELWEKILSYIENQKRIAVIKGVTAPTQLTEIGLQGLLDNLKTLKEFSFKQYTDGISHTHQVVQTVLAAKKMIIELFAIKPLPENSNFARDFDEVYSQFKNKGDEIYGPGEVPLETSQAWSRICFSLKCAFVVLVITAACAVIGAIPFGLLGGAIAGAEGAPFFSLAGALAGAVVGLCIASPKATEAMEQNRQQQHIAQVTEQAKEAKKAFNVFHDEKQSRPG
jgi:hypothetical protein